ncbi:hypothetical protein [Actinomadura sp. 6N118]|uniref:hypothetical protein n=1 Tax=Actinomadura sp. 6N118 TaxID=3375151 RepID=UPI003787F58B
MIVKRIGVLAVAGATAGMAFTVTSAPAEAAAYPKGSCGSGYAYKGKIPIQKGWVGNKRVTKHVGDVYVYYRKSGRTVCAITRVVGKYAGPSKTDTLGVTILSKLGNRNDSGGYHYYAGPVKRTLKKTKCVTIYGKQFLDKRAGGGAYESAWKKYCF